MIAYTEPYAAQNPKFPEEAALPLGRLPQEIFRFL
jgi:hypothetical protein